MESLRTMTITETITLLIRSIQSKLTGQQKSKAKRVTGGYTKTENCGEGRWGAGKVRPCCVFLGQRVEVINPSRFVVGGGGCKLTFKDRAINNDNILNQFFTILVQFKGCFGLRVRSVFFRTPLGLFDFLFLPLKDSRLWR